MGVFEIKHPAEVWSLQQFFKFGLDRDIPELHIPPEGEHLNLGPGKRKVIPETTGLGLPEWNANYNSIPREKGTVAAIHCYQFLEHFDGDQAVELLWEMERVLMPGGCIYLATPYYTSAMAYQALDHKSWWNEEVWHWLFGNEYYDDHEGDGWKLRVHLCVIMGIVERNINLFTQLVKAETHVPDQRPLHTSFTASSLAFRPQEQGRVTGSVGTTSGVVQEGEVLGARP